MRTRNGAPTARQSDKLKQKCHSRDVFPQDVKGIGADPRRGAELIEFTLVLLPMLAMLFVLLDFAWIVFAQATMVRAVRVAVRTGITLTAAQMVGSACLTDTVKALVQQNALGLLQGTTGLAFVKVNYYLPPVPGSTAADTDVSTQSSGNAPGNI